MRRELPSMLTLACLATTPALADDKAAVLDTYANIAQGRIPTAWSPHKSCRRPSKP